MNKLEFINALGEKLTLLPPEEVTGILSYYAESIDDRMEDGMDEEAAIASLGSIDELAQKILAEQEHLVPPAAPEPPKFDQEIPSDVPPAPEPKKRRMSPASSCFWCWAAPYGSRWPGAGLRGLRHLDRRLGGARLPADCRGGYGLCRSSRRHLQLFVPVSPATFAVRLLASGSCLAVAGVGLFLLPLSLWLIRGFAHLHTLPFRGRKEAL